MKAFRQRDLVRAIKSARLAGLSVERIEIDPNGKIVVVSAKPDTPADVAEQHNRKGKPWRILNQQD